MLTQAQNNELMHFKIHLQYNMYEQATNNPDKKYKLRICHLRTKQKCILYNLVSRYEC